MAANYFDSAFLAFQGKVMKGLADHEVRELDTQVLDYALKNQSFFEDKMNINEIKKSVQRPVYGYQFNRRASTGGTGMTTFPSGPLGSTTQIPLSFVTFSENFATYNVSGLDNVEQFVDIMRDATTQAMRNLRTRIRQWLVNNLYINRTTYGLPGLKNANFNASTNAFELTGQNPWSAMTSVMRQNSYQASAYTAFMDSAMYPQFENSIAQGTMNGVNQSWQFDKTPIMPNRGGYFENLWEEPILGSSVTIEPGYTNGTALVMPNNSFAFVPWMPANYYAPGFSKNFDGYTGGYGKIGDDKYRGLEYQLFGWNNQSDTSGSNGYSQSQTQNWQIGFTAAFVMSYLSNTGESPIYQFAFQG